MKHIKIRKYILSVLLCVSMASLAAPIDEVRKLYRKGDYEEAIKKVKPILKRTPKSGNANYFYGASLMAIGQCEEAVAPLKKAIEREVADASRILAEYAIENYRVDEAAAYMQSWETQLNEDEKDIPEQFSAMSNRIVKLRNMLDRVEKIEILDTLTVDKEEFIKSVRLSAGAGSLLPPENIKALGVGSPGADLLMAYLPQSHTRILWSECDTTGVFKLHEASILNDGTIEAAAELDGELGEGGDAVYPFLMPDGVTLYFANNGENSLGGYDIYMTRQNEEGGFYAPQNMGFPYNSMANDYMLAIDEAAGLGWLVSDRNAQEGKVTIFIFSPSAMRVNVTPGSSDLVSYARLDNISITRNPETDYKALLAKKMPTEMRNDADVQTTFLFDAGTGKVYTTLNDFKSREARGEMIKYIAAERELSKHLALEDELRLRFRKGDKSVVNSILRSEVQTAELRKKCDELRNKVASLENGNK